ncbi:NlpC/P60 family protein [Lysobacter sp. HA35]
MTQLADFVGLPFADHGRADGFDCWGGVRAVLSACLGLKLPDYGDGYSDCADHSGIACAIRDGLAADFVRVTDPRAFDLVIFNIAGQPRHVGVMVGPTSFLHWPEDGTSRIERTDNRMWHKRIEGFYRHAG